MVTRNYKNLLTGMLQAGTTKYCLPMTDVEGYTFYFSSFSAFPYSITNSATATYNNSGISVGSDGTPPTEFDYNLGHTITSGINIAMTAQTSGYDNDGLWINYAVTITNTGSIPVIIREIGYKQTIRGFIYPEESTSSNTFATLLDRTVLSEPVTIQPGDAGIIHYKLKTITDKIINGVKIVSWFYGSDEDVSAMIIAARQGIIDLHTDAGWCIGDIRYINIAAFTAGDVVVPAQRVPLGISSFKEYENCGNIMQLDFRGNISETVRMNSTNTNVNYGTSEMYTTTLPAFEAALPSWLRGLLLTFNVKVSAGNKSDNIITVTGNKLALRSEIELSGTTNYSKPGEGEQVNMYKQSSVFINKTNNGYYWTRSPYYNGNTSYVAVYNTSSIGSYSPSTKMRLSPFMCV